MKYSENFAPGKMVPFNVLKSAPVSELKCEKAVLRSVFFTVIALPRPLLTTR